MAVSIYNLDNTHISGSAGIAGSKMQHDFNGTISQTGTVVAGTYYVRIARGAGTINKVQACITETVATGADRTVTIDVKKSTGGGAFASILSATIVFNNGSTALVVSTGTISTSAIAAGDILQVTVAVAGAAGAQALGLAVTVTTREDPS